MPPPVPASAFIVPLSLAILVNATASSAQDEDQGSTPDTRWRAEVGIGAEYDTNVSVDEVDLSSGQSDYASILDFELSVQHALGERTKFSASYDVSQSSYREFSRVDRLTQIIGSDINLDIGKGSAGVSGYYIDSRLDGEGFLEYLRVSPYASGFLARRWFARGAYVYSERSIDERPQRDAETQTGEVDLYFFHRGLRSYANIGYRYRTEDAVASELDFTAHALKLRYIRRVELLNRRAKAELALRYEVRDYRNPEPTIGIPRKDDRWRWKLDFEVPVSSRLTWQCYLSYGDYESNLPRADFTQTILGTRLAMSW